MIRNKVKEFFIIIMVINMMEIGSKIKERVMEYLYKIIIKYIKDTGKMIYKMVKEN